MEEVLHIILPIAVGALIGYCTNYIAIKMLFRPQKPICIGSWRLPFTPGIIPKNKPRIAKAIANAIDRELLTSEDLLKGIKESPLRERICDTAVGILFSKEDSIDGYLEQFLEEGKTEHVKYRLSELITAKLTDAMKKLNISEILMKLVQSSFSSLLSNPLIAMFLNEQTISSIGEKLGSAWTDYVTLHGREMIFPIVKDEVYAAAAKPMEEHAAALKLSEQQVREMTGRAFDLLVENKGKEMLDKLDICTVIEDKINAMEVQQLEELVMSVMKQELQAVINLGLLIGAVIGAINIIW